LVGFTDTIGRSYFPGLLGEVLCGPAASTAAPALSSMLIYILMAAILIAKPQGLFPANTK
jgi:branched-chain amino acid transport system permease protein